MIMNNNMFRNMSHNIWQRYMSLCIPGLWTAMCLITCYTTCGSDVCAYVSRDYEQQHVTQHVAQHMAVMYVHVYPGIMNVYVSRNMSHNVWQCYMCICVPGLWTTTCDATSHTTCGSDVCACISRDYEQPHMCMCIRGLWTTTCDITCRTTYGSDVFDVRLYVRGLTVRTNRGPGGGRACLC